MNGTWGEAIVKLIGVEFEKGGSFVATLLENEAPRTCSAIWDKLPIVSEAQHAQYSGKIIFFFAPQIGFTELENPKLMNLVPGDIALNTHPLHKLHLTPSLGIPLEILIAYGGSLQADWCGPSPVNHFAKIAESDLDDLVKAGMRNRREGFEKIVLRKIE